MACTLCEVAGMDDLERVAQAMAEILPFLTELTKAAQPKE